MFLTQIYGTLLGGFISYAIMMSIISRNKALLVNGNGNASWSGANVQAYNTNAASWALASYLYKIGAQYQMVPIGMAIGSAAVVVHRLFVHVSRLRSNSDHFFLSKTNTFDFCSLFLRSGTSKLQTSISHSLSCTLAMFLTTRIRLVLSSAG